MPDYADLNYDEFLERRIYDVDSNLDTTASGASIASAGASTGSTGSGGLTNPVTTPGVIAGTTPVGAFDLKHLNLSALNPNEDIGTSNFITGVSGWRIRGDGTIEVNDAIVRGTIYATAGVIANWTISTDSLSTGAFNTSGTMYFGASGLSLSDIFSVTSLGILTAASGTIGGWSITSNSLYSTGIKMYSGLNPYLSFGSTPPSDASIGTGLFLDATGLYGLASSSQKFKLDALTGEITAIAGSIGGFTIKSDALYGSTIKTSETVAQGSSGVIMDTAGLRGYDSVLGKTFDLPTDGSAPTFASGTIINTTFEVNTNAVIRTSNTVGDGSAQSAGLLMNNTGFYACEASQTLADANIKFLIDGTAVIKTNLRGGQTDFNTGIGYFIGLSSGAYKLSIGDPATNYLTWDGTFLKLKGSFDVGQSGLINNSSYLVADLPVALTIVGPNPPSAYE